MASYEDVVFYCVLPVERDPNDVPILIESLQTFTSDIRIFQDEDQCLADMKSISGKNLILVLDLDEPKLFDSFIDLDELYFIYLVKPYRYNCSPKFRGVFPSQDQLLVQLTKDVKLLENTDTHLRVTSIENGQRHQASADYAQDDYMKFLWSKIILDLLLEIPRPSENVHEELLIECRRIYQNNQIELKAIDEFERTYDPSKAIWWYTRPSFVYRLVNMALRTENILIILKFRFVIQDIYQQLRQISNEQRDNSSGVEYPDEVTLYRGQLITPNELEKFRNAIGKMILMTSFTSTTRDLETAYMFSGAGGQRPSFESVIFEIVFKKSEFVDEVPPPFADIHRESFCQDEAEVLLCMGTMMELESIRMDSSVTYIRLRICQCDESEIKKMRENIFWDASIAQVDSESALLLQLTSALAARGDLKTSKRLLSMLKSSENPFLDLLATGQSYCSRLQNNCFEGFPDNSTFITDVKQVCISLKNILPLLSSLSEDQNIIKPLQRFMDLLENKVINNDSVTAMDIDEMKSEIFTFSDTLPIDDPTWSSMLSSKAYIESIMSLFSIQDILPGFSNEVAHNFYTSFRADTQSRQQMFYDMGMKAFCETNYDQATQHFNEALASPGPSEIYTRCHVTLARIHVHQKNFLEAMKSYQAIIDSPDLPPNSHHRYIAYLDRGDAYLSLDDISRASQSYAEALTMLNQHYRKDHPLTSHYHFHMIKLARKNGDQESALDYFEKTLAYKSISFHVAASAYQEIGWMYMDVEDYENARVTFLQYFQFEKQQDIFISQNHVTCMLNVALVEHKVGNYQQRDFYIDQAMQTVPNNSKLREHIMNEAKANFDLTLVDPFVVPQLELD